MTAITIIVISMLCSTGFVNKITKPGNILGWLPGRCQWLPAAVQVPLFQCSACGSFWWAVLITITYLFANTLLLYIFIPFAAVGLTTILTHVFTQIN